MAALMTVIAFALTGAVAPIIVSRAAEPARDANPFRLDQGSATVDTRDLEAVVLDHPVDPGLRASIDPSDGIPHAMRNAPWFQGDFATAQGWSFELDTIWRPVNIFPEQDFRGGGLSVLDGRRGTWAPPPCDCQPIEVWMYGGSTTYGLNQRDDRTIASALAKLAHRDGIPVTVRNHGVLGYLHWLEAERFAYDLLVDDPPDLVIFYDGVNEAWATSVLNDRRSGDLPPPVDPTNSDVWSYTGRSEPPQPAGPDGSRFIGWDRGVVLGMTDLVHTTMRRYERSRQLTRLVAERHGIEVRYVWQPSRVSRDLIEGEPHGDAAAERYVRLRDQLQTDLLPEDVLDLSDVFDGNTDAIFTDDVHHNELGARIVAEALYADLEPDLRRLSGG